MELKKRKPTRLKDYDYSSDGVYFVTICVKDRKQVLCKIVGEGLRALPKIEYTKIGTHVKNAIEYIEIHNPNIFIDNYVVMPNHIHLLIRIENETGGHGGTALPRPFCPSDISPIRGISPTIFNFMFDHRR